MIFLALAVEIVALILRFSISVHSDVPLRASQMEIRSGPGLGIEHLQFSWTTKLVFAVVCNPDTQDAIDKKEEIAPLMQPVKVHALCNQTCAMHLLPFNTLNPPQKLPNPPYLDVFSSFALHGSNQPR